MYIFGDIRKKKTSTLNTQINMNMSEIFPYIKYT